MKAPPPTESKADVQLTRLICYGHAAR